MNKICTTIEQSKKLLELGIDVNTADMCWSIFKTSWGERIYTIVAYPMLPNQEKGIEKIHEDLPAWSLTALLGVIPKHIKNYNVLRNDISDNDFAIWYDDVSNGCVNETLPDITMESAVDACYEMIVKLKEQTLI